MIHIEDVLLNALAQDGDNYVSRVPPDFANPDPHDFDCSGLVAWACARSKVEPILPHSAYMQAQLCIKHDLEITVAEAFTTRGALLFKFLDENERPIEDVSALKDRPKFAHVAFSLGNGSTFEAASPTLDVLIFPNAATRVWTHGGRLPGVDYAQRPPPKQPDNDQEEEEMQKVAFYKGPADGEVHAYLVTGGIGKHLSKEALALHTYLEVTTVGSITEPLGKDWQDGVALLDGPLQNVGTLT